MDLRRFEALYAEHAQRIFGFLAYRTGDPDAAEDLLSDVFERALRRRGLFNRRRGSEEAWLYAIALNLVRDRHRRARTERQGRERLDRERAPDAPDHGALVGERDAVMAAIRTLSAPEREVVALRFGADLSAPQIAQVLHLPLTTVEGRLYRALRRLREHLEAPAVPPRR